MILLKRIQLNNFLSHENTTIDFEENEKALIDGLSGAGKSSIFDAIIWCLYGISRADNRSLVRKGTKMGEVILQLKKDEDIVTITRRITSVGKHILIVTTEQIGGIKIPFVISGTREIQNWIEKELIGASYLLFVNSAAYVQGNTESFVMQPASKRKELLLEIIRAEDYTKHYENARKTLSTLENDANKVSWETTALMTDLANLQAIISTRGDHLKVISDSTVLLNDLEPKLQALESEKAGFVASSLNIENLDKILVSASNDMDIAASELMKKIAKTADKKKMQELVCTAPELNESIILSIDRLSKLRKELSEASNIETIRKEVLQRKPVVNDYNFQNIDKLKRDIKKIQAEPVCPSGEDCPYSGDHKGKIKRIKADIKKLENVIKKETKALADWTKESNELPVSVELGSIIREIETVEGSVKDQQNKLVEMSLIKKDIESIEEIEKEIPVLKSALEIKQARVMSADIEKRKAERLLNKDEMDRISNEILSKKQEKEQLEYKIVKATTALENISESEDKIKTNEFNLSSKKIESDSIKEKIRKVELIKQAFGSKGIETLVIDFLLPKLEDKINEVLGKLSDFRVRLDTQKKSLDGESIIEGLFITILNESNEEMPFETYSGGEKLKISVAISEALASLQKVGFRLFDETFIGLDENSTESFARVLESLQKNFGQVLCISHLLQVKDLFDKKIKIIKIKGVSAIK